MVAGNRVTFTYNKSESEKTERTVTVEKMHHNRFGIGIMTGKDDNGEYRTFTLSKMSNVSIIS